MNWLDEFYFVDGDGDNMFFGLLFGCNIFSKVYLGEYLFVKDVVIGIGIGWYGYCVKG